ncbi:MAG: hypothetical protein JW941_04330 [Candidatus Coatesbacteria bacterium]|nr:hypothetical protein [Candidatus Coatesbacteria bacterium]
MVANKGPIKARAFEHKLGALLLLIPLIGLVNSLLAGEWTIHDFGRTVEIGMMSNDRRDGIWLSAEISGDPFTKRLLHARDLGGVDWIRLPEGWDLATKAFYVRSALHCQQNRLVAPLYSVDSFAKAIWCYSDESWELIAGPEGEDYPYYWDSMDWVRSTSDNKWSAGFSWSEGGSYPRSYAAMVNLVDGDFVEVDESSSYHDYVSCSNDGASWISNGARVMDWRRIDRTGARRRAESPGNCIAITPYGTWLECEANWPPATGYTLYDKSFEHGIIWSAEFGGSAPELFARAPFGSGSYLIFGNQLSRMSPSDRSWHIEIMSILPALADLENPSFIDMVLDSGGNLWIAFQYVYGRGIHGEIYYGAGLARYDRTDELIDPTITLTVGLDVIEPGDTTVVNASIAPGQRTYDADVYAVIQTPSGDLLSYPWDVEGVHPIAENLHFTPETFISDFILLHIEQPLPLPFGLDGDYMVYVALMEPGTLNPIGEIATVPFELRLSETTRD